MIIYKKVQDLRLFINSAKQKGLSTGFVPTMGALHDGHIELVRTAKKATQLVTCSIFVNPTQFNDPKDFEKYPQTIEKDIYLLEKAGCDLLFLPTVDEMYPDGKISDTHYELGSIETLLEGKYRPGHFQGVCQVVHRLLHIVQPGKLYLGQKDFQQCMVIKKLVELIQLNVEVVVCPTQREKDGLAMSSRNMRLNEAARIKAVRLYESLLFIRKEIKPGYINDLRERAFAYLTGEGFKVDYVEIANAYTLETVNNWDGKTQLVALVAAFLDEVRLIDNLLLND